MFVDVEKVQDVFIVVVNFISNNWEAKHITIGLFEVILTPIAWLWFLSYDIFFHIFSLMHKILAYMKDDGSNL